VQACEGIFFIFEIAKGPGANLEIVLSRGSQADLSRVAMKQPDTEPFFKLLDALADIARDTRMLRAASAKLPSFAAITKLSIAFI
jgi:hypothetical protein